jgi:hypothetical protein
MDLRTRLIAVERGGGQVVRRAGVDWLCRPVTDGARYVDAELAVRQPWLPPVDVTIRARFSQPVDRLRGTAGFGFWNAALSPGSLRLGLPRAIWFFGAGPPHDMPLALGVPGRGFKAGILDTQRVAFLALLPAAPLGILAMRVPALYRRFWPVAQRAIGVEEVDLSAIDVTSWHDYTLRWNPRSTHFAVDGSTVLATTTATGGPLQFVAWIDNAYAIATPQGRLRLGYVASDEIQSIEIESVRLA